MSINCTSNTCGPPGINGLSSPHLKSTGEAKFCSGPGFTGLSSTPQMRNICFDSPFATQCAASAVNCIQSYSTRGSCFFDSECRSNTCLNGQCAPFQPAHAQAISRLSYQDYMKYMAAATGGDMKRIPTADCKEGMVLAQMPDGNREVLCPIPYEPRSMPVCQQAYQNLWQCNQYKDSSKCGAADAYQTCRKMQDCFVYNMEYPDGTTAPVSVKMNNMCLGAAKAAVEQTASRCVTAQGPGCPPGAQFLAPARPGYS
jgi:hypothetical protein